MELKVYLNSQMYVRVQVENFDEDKFNEELRDRDVRLVTIGGQRFEKHSIMMIVDENAEVILNG